MNRREVVAGIGAGLGALALAPRALAATGTDPLIFAYFATGKAGEAAGLRLATSDDGYSFRDLAQGRDLLVPQVGEKKLLRDPFLFRANGLYHLLWTTAWDGVTIGHAVSRDLVRWSGQRALPVMASIPGTRNCWAPEAIWDGQARNWMLFWSSTVDGRFTATAGSSETGYNHRLWRTTTRDFRQFTPPQPLYDPGFSVIDGTFARLPDDRLILIVKDETVAPPRKWLQTAVAQSPSGPFAPLSPPFTASWVEGPMTAQVGDALICYYDIYRDGRWGAAMTRDGVEWQDVSHRLSMPTGARHGSLLRVPRRLIDSID